MARIDLNSFFSVFFCLNREIIVNLIMMQNWRRKRRSANTIYRDIVPKEKTAFICMISFIEMGINRHTDISSLWFLKDHKYNLKILAWSYI